MLWLNIQWNINPENSFFLIQFLFKHKIQL